MSFHAELQARTEAGRQYLLAAPIIQRALRGEVTRAEYVAFLNQAFHHVKHTVPLLMATGARLPDTQEWLREAIAEYIEEEIGHHEWILNDIVACGYDREKARHSQPNFATEIMVAYAYDAIARCSPLAFFGMVQVLEGTSILIAEKAADSIRTALQLPVNAFTYLRSHGALDQEHIKFFASLMDRLDDPHEQACIVHAANMFYRLYGDVFRSIDAEQALTLAA
jgi:pyrroloquinoline quinone (PQQ) biosynthesis protein C